jgi:glycosyltransferase involved in cell wall biosynthesis
MIVVSHHLGWVFKLMSISVSVLCSVYNGGAYLSQSIGSILKQTYLDFEFIIINDASNDNTEEVILSYDDSRIKYFKNDTNLGLAASLNRGLQLAKGELIVRQDADDISLSQRIEKQVEFFKSNPEISCLGSSVELVNPLCKHIEYWIAPCGEKNIHKFFCFDNALAHSSVCFRKDTILSLGGYNTDYQFCQDFDLWLRLLKANKRIENLDRVLVKRRIGTSVHKATNDIQVKKELNEGLIYRHLKSSFGESIDLIRLKEFISFCVNIRYEENPKHIPEGFEDVIVQIMDSLNDLKGVNVNRDPVYECLANLAYQMSAVNVKNSLKLFFLIKKLNPNFNIKFSYCKIILRFLGLRKIYRTFFG